MTSERRPLAGPVIPYSDYIGRIIMPNVYVCVRGEAKICQINGVLRMGLLGGHSIVGLLQMFLLALRNIGT